MSNPIKDTIEAGIAAAGVIASSKLFNASTLDLLRAVGKVKEHPVQGLAAVHTIEVVDSALTVEEWNKRKAAGWRMDPWGHGPYTNGSFTSAGKAVGWLKKLLKKPGWPEATRWEVWRDINGGDNWTTYLVSQK